jgi:hypothetical protein
MPNVVKLLIALQTDTQRRSYFHPIRRLSCSQSPGVEITPISHYVMCLPGFWILHPILAPSPILNSTSLQLPILLSLSLYYPLYNKPAPCPNTSTSSTLSASKSSRPSPASSTRGKQVRFFVSRVSEGWNADFEVDREDRDHWWIWRVSWCLKAGEFKADWMIVIPVLHSSPLWEPCDS